MTFRTGLELFKSIWLIEPQAALSYLQMWEQFMQHPEGRLFRAHESEEKCFDKAKVFAAADGVKYAPVDLWSNEAKTFTGFEGAHTVMIPIEGPLMKNDYCGYAGTATITKFFQLANKAKSVQQILLLGDSPGGTVDGTALLSQAIAASQKNVKTVIGGMACSAMYWIASSAKGGVYATSATDIVGSIGTMISWYDRSKYLEANGIILREYFATKSEDKNKAFREASKGDGKLLVQQMLNPMNNEFLSAVKANRDGKLNLEAEDVLTGKTYTAKDALKYGLIDGILPLDDILEQSAPKQKKQSHFSMKNFKLVLAAAAIASVYSEDKFFGLTEEQLEKVEGKMQADTDAAIAAAASIATLKKEVETANAATKTANDALAAANTKATGLEAEVTRLKALTAPPAAQAAKEADDTEEKIPETSVEKWAREALGR